MLVWSPFLRLVLITYVYVCVRADYGSLFMHHRFHAEWYGLAAQIYLCLVIAMTWGFFQWCDVGELGHTSIREKWGSLYQGLKTETFYSMVHTIMFYVRRILFIMAL